MVFLGLMLMAVGEFADDIRSVPNSVRLVVQFAGMGLMFLQLGLFAGLPWWYILVALVLSVFNFRKRALCFAGDVGSVSMAYLKSKGK